jgi:hypothetical protein
MRTGGGGKVDRYHDSIGYTIPTPPRIVTKLSSEEQEEQERFDAFAQDDILHKLGGTTPGYYIPPEESSAEQNASGCIIG